MLLHILSVNKKSKNGFDKKPSIVYRRNKTLHQIIGGDHILKSMLCVKVIKTTNNQKCSQYIS